MSCRDFFYRLAGKPWLEPFWDCWADFGAIVRFSPEAIRGKGGDFAWIEAFFNLARAKGFSFISIDELATLLGEGRPLKKVLVATFDGVAPQSVEPLLSVLKAADVPALFYFAFHRMIEDRIAPEVLARYAGDPYLTFGCRLSNDAVRAQTDSVFRREIVQAQAVFEATGIRPCHLAYSSKESVHVRSVLGKAFEDFGFRTAATDRSDVLMAGADVFALPCLMAPGESSDASFLYEALARHVFSAGDETAT